MANLLTGPEGDWLLDSLEKYEGIYIYELQYPTSFLEWKEDGSAVWLVSTSGNNSSEILQLALPERLLPTESQTLLAKRDFKLVNGAITKSHITAIKYMVASQRVVTGDSAAEVQVWASDEDESADMLLRVDEMKVSDENPIKSSLLLDVSPAHPTLILCGSTSSLSSLQVLDLTTKQSTFHVSPPGHSGLLHDPLCDPLHAAAFLGRDCLFASCSGRGHLNMWDFRASATRSVAATPTTDATPITNATPTLAGPSVPSTIMESTQPTTTPTGTTPTMPTGTTPTTSTEATPTMPTGATPTTYSLSCHPDTHNLALLASTGHLGLYDSRHLGHTLASCLFSTKEAVKLGVRFCRSQVDGTPSLPPPCVKHSPTSPHTISVSGVSAGVQVYDTTMWAHDIKDPTPLFLHSGHEQENPNAHVLVHSWQPGVKGAAILSVDSLANLHAWQWTHHQVEPAR